MKKVKFNVYGMTCSSCQSHVDKAVRSLNGVKNVNLNLLSNNMDVEFDDIISEESIIKAVKYAGYDAKIYDKKQDVSNLDNIRSMKKRLIYSIIFWIILMYVAMQHMINFIPTLDILNRYLFGKENLIINGILQLVLLTPIVILNRNYFLNGFKKLFRKSPNMDSLIALGASASIIYSLYVLIVMIYNKYNLNSYEVVHDFYFESAGTILTLITIGKYLETKSKGRTGDAISKLINLAPKVALKEENGKEEKVLVDDLNVKDIIIIKPGESIPVDGVIIEGKTSVDESSITGESIPVSKEVGDKVISGTLNKNGLFKMEVSAVGEDTVLNQIISLVEEASNSKAPISRLADKVSFVFVPIVIIISLITFIIWMVLGYGLEFSLTMAIAVLVISCPCALGLATPVAIMVGTGKAAENGILFKNAESLENLYKANSIIFDKTGTITEGKPKVIKIVTNQNIIDKEINNKNIKVIENKENVLNAENALLKIAASIESGSEHPLAEAIINEAKMRNIEKEKIKNFVSVSGRGIKAEISNKKVIGGNKAFMLENKVDITDFENIANEFLKDGKICLYFARESKILGLIVISDVIKQDSKKAILNLKSKCNDLFMITGDNIQVAKSIANEIGINNVIADVMPQDKEKEVAKLVNEGKNVVFVGDGINDAPALAKASIGIAIGSGTDIAIDSADIVLMKNSLMDVIFAMSLSHKIINNIKLSLFWAFIYNILGIPVAAGLFYIPFGIKLNPMIGAACMSLSSVCVVLNALRLNKIKKVKIGGNDMNEYTVYVDGMHCDHCKMAVEKALNSIDGVVKAEVNLRKKLAKVESSIELSEEKVREVIENEGFTFKKIK